MDSIKLFVPLIPGNSGRDSLPLSYIVPHKNLYVLENHNSKIFAVCRLGQQHKCGCSYIYSNLHNNTYRQGRLFHCCCNCEVQGMGRERVGQERSLKSLNTLTFQGQLFFMLNFLNILLYIIYGMLLHMGWIWWIALNIWCVVVLNCVEYGLWLCWMWCSIVLMVVSWLVRTPERPWRQYICINVAIAAVYLANVASVANLTF